ncbi:(2Fe-2S)-binding protein [Elioraea sp.]|uniref:(2Fe-2S)-binding protein n=1 Tax=Elioraea sp. TaxID=2185103 RepID=UPI0025C6B31B|nr:(2Fe-2S)-binding protein [Elioraea sp.]
MLDRTAASATITIDGDVVQAFAGESVLVAVLAHTTRLRTHEVDGAPRAGFCLMGACQDCWVWLADGHRIRACTTRVVDGMAVLTGPPAGPADA